MKHTVYIIECRDKTLYTGCTNNLVRRINEHNSGRGGAKYTRGRTPVKIVYKKNYSNLAIARKKEAEIKRLTRMEKLILISKSYETHAWSAK